LNTASGQKLEAGDRSLGIRLGKNTVTVYTYAAGMQK